MGEPKLQIAFGEYDRTRVLVDGTVKIEGVDASFHSDRIVAEVFAVMIRDCAYDVAELGMSYFLRTMDFDDPPFIALPIFPSRCSRHSAIYIGLGSFVLVGNPQAVEKIFSQDSKFDIGRTNALAVPLVGQNSLLLMDGDRHRRERKLLMSAFHGERLQSYAQQISRITEQVANHWQVGQPFVARTEMQKISLEVILQVVFGLSEGDRYQRLKPLLKDWTNLTNSPLRASLLFLPFLKVTRLLNRFFREVIASSHYRESGGALT